MKVLSLLTRNTMKTPVYFLSHGGVSPPICLTFAEARPTHPNVESNK